MFDEDTTRGGNVMQVEVLADFNEERISERVVHDRGASAKGSFEVTHEAFDLTCANLLRAPGFRTPVIVQFSIILHKHGSPETLQDPCGFAVPSYTKEGTFDLMENNLPVSCVCSNIQFQNMVYPFMPKPESHIQDNWRMLIAVLTILRTCTCFLSPLMMWGFYKTTGT
ncbi:hypothetical protein Nepgr_028069 [Nepenthes gracilis]|uniref:catalase n=1 Tax=Nepenthes gracilis TaxID=150966 RepID=A0AAD3TCG6_NEPGR|nr:hypothetical protein Nepgr_028069 [Nepenthes gracilis]